MRHGMFPSRPKCYWEVWCVDCWWRSFIYSCRKHVWPNLLWNHQVGCWGLGNSRQRVNHPFFEKPCAYCGSWQIWPSFRQWIWLSSLLSCRTRAPGIHPASPKSFMHLLMLRCQMSRSGRTRKFTYWAEQRWHQSWLRILIAKETSVKTEQWVVIPGHKPNNEQLQ